MSIRTNCVASTCVAALALVPVAAATAAGGGDGSSAANVARDVGAALSAQRPAAVATARADGVRVPTDGYGKVVARTGPGERLTMALPTAGSAGERVGPTTVFPGAAQDTQVAVQPTDHGFRALVRLIDEDAPTRHAFPLGGDAARLKALPEGRVSILDASGEEIAMVDAPWARDADGREVPTRYEVDGTTLVQVVDHRSAAYRYPIVADPSVWKVAKCVAHVGGFIAGNALAILKIRKAGGVVKVAKILLGKGRREQKLKAALVVFGNIAGIDAVVRNC